MSANTSYPTIDTSSIWKKDRDHFIHPWTDLERFDERGCLVIAEGHGAHVTDSEGRRYLDGIGGLWCVNIGYGRPEMGAALAEQASRLPFYNTFTDTTNPPAAQLAEKLASLAPRRLNHVFFGSGGSDANDTTVRLIHHYFNRLGKPSKKKIISRFGAYHGSTYLAMTLTGVTEDHADFDLAPDLVHYVSCPDPYRRPDGTTLDEFRGQLVAEFEAKILELGPDNVAAFFAEPIMGAGGVIVPPPGYHQEMQAVCRRHDVLYVSDEVVTGFGRIGHMLSSEPAFGIDPDVITCAKGITSGYVPLGATLISDEIHDVIRRPSDTQPYLCHGFTYSGHPVSCAAALTNIDILEREHLCEHVRALGPYFEAELARLEDLPIVGDVRGSHFMLCVENVRDKASKALFEEEVRIGDRIAAHCQKRGLLVRPVGHLNILSPPLVIGRAEIDEMVDVLHAGIEATMDDLEREGIALG
jgi:adenosylmethionine-8-amino-7-oxononanoate aminotransferase